MERDGASSMSFFRIKGTSTSCSKYEVSFDRETWCYVERGPRYEDM